MSFLGIGFDRPAWLWALLLVPAFAAFFALALRARRKALVRLLGETSRERLTTMAGGNRRAAEAAVGVLTLALVVTALAGPRWGEATDRIKRTGVDVTIVLDASRSMLAQDIAPSRLERAKREVRGLLDAAAGSRVSLVTFAGDARVVCPFTLDHDTVLLFLDDVDPGLVHAGGSDLAAALRAAGEALEGASGAGKAVVVLSDGESFESASGAASAAAKLAARGVKVHAIGLGTKGGAKIPVEDENGRPGFFEDTEGKEVVTRLEGDVLREVARAGGGEYLSAATVAFPMDELWSKRISRMARAQTGAEEVESLQPRFQWFLAAAVITASLWWLAPLGVGQRRRRGAGGRAAPRTPSQGKRRREPGAVAAAGRTVAALLAVVGVALAPACAFAGPAEDGRQGDALYRKGDYAAAAAAYQESTRGRPSALAAHNLGNAQYRAGNFGAAAKAWSDAEKMSIDANARRDAFYNRGLALLQQADGDPALTVPMLEESIAAFDAALGLDPMDRDARHNRAIAIARWVDAQRNAQRGGGSSNQDPKSGQPGGDQDDAQESDGDRKGDPSEEGQPKKGEEGNEGEDGRNGERRNDGGKPEAERPPESGEPGAPTSDGRISDTEMQRIEQLLDQHEREQRRIDRVKAGMRRQDGEKDW